MKYLIYSILMVLPIIVSAEVEDPLKYHHGVLIEFDGATINQFGYRYRMSDNSRVSFRIHIEYEKYRNNNSAINNSNSDVYSSILGYEQNIYSIGSASLFLSAGILYERSFSDFVIWSNPPESEKIKNTSTRMGAIVGIGVEYYFTEQLSLFSHQDIEWSSFKYTHDPVDNAAYTSGTTLEFAYTKVGLTFYF